MSRRSLFAAVLAIVAPPALADAGHDHEIAPEPAEASLRAPVMDASRGRELFVEKGCVICHAVNGVGGEGAVSLDAHTMEAEMSPFDLAAKMWAMAPVMIPAQEDVFGEQILFTGEELGNIVAFLHDDAEQHKLEEDDLPPDVLAKLGHTHDHAPGEEGHAEEPGH